MFLTIFLRFNPTVWFDAMKHHMIKNITAMWVNLSSSVSVEACISSYLSTRLHQSELRSAVIYSPSSWSLVITISLPRSTFTTDRQRREESRRSEIQTDAASIIENTLFRTHVDALTCSPAGLQGVRGQDGVSGFRWAAHTCLVDCADAELINCVFLQSYDGILTLSVDDSITAFPLPNTDVTPARRRRDCEHVQKLL